MFKLLLYYAKRPLHFVKTGLFQGVPSQFRYRFPNRKLIISLVTGTDGKTTTSTLLYHILKTNGYKVGLVSTVAAFIGQEESDTGFHVTTPQPPDLYQFMRKMVDQNYTHLVLEATSHGSYQYRLWGIAPKFAGLTNISHEHLDYHVNYKEYVKAKLRLFKNADTVFLNEDDRSYSTIKKLNPSLQHRTYSAGQKLPKTIQTAINKRFPESYNQLNARLAVALAQINGVPDKVIAEAIETFPGIPGRLETVITKPCKVVVDFAHTPKALESVLTTLKQQQQQKGSKLITVSGCAGLRDVTKRPMMGKILSQLADLAIFTAEDPRTEDVWSIIRQMKEGIETGHDKVLSIPDRAEAIRFAVNNLASSKDTVVVLGKGHEQSMCFGTEEYPWNDAQAIKTIASEIKKKK